MADAIPHGNQRLGRWSRQSLVRLVIVCAMLMPGKVYSADAGITLDGYSVHPTRLLARLAPENASGRSAAGALAMTNSTIARRLSTVPGLVVLEERPIAAAGGIAAVADPAARLRARLQELRRTGLFAYVEPDYVVSLDAPPIDARFADGTLWGLHNSGHDGGVAGMDINAARAWNVTTGSSAVIVAVIDTGINYTHVDLRDQMWRNPGEIPGNGRDEDANGIVDDVYGINAITGTGDPRDDHDHGSHVAGTIGAGANDGHPLVGVNWHVRLMACKFLRAEGWGYTSDAVTCVDYAVRHGARVINASWGGGGYTQALVDAINAAGEHNVLFVAAAGNSGLNLQSELGERYPAYPAAYNVDAILAVAAIDRAGALAPFSNFGTLSVDLGAPGVAVLSALGGLEKHGYGTLSGTSMAAPHVAGVAALALAAHPGLSVREWKNLLLRTATPTPGLAGRTVTGGRVDAFAAVSAAPDAQLELDLSFPADAALYAGRETVVLASVSDLFSILGATVTGVIEGGGAIDFADDGLAPDARAGDGVFAGRLAVPSGAREITLSVAAAAAGQSPAAVRVTVPVAQPPANDAWADALPLTGTSAWFWADNFGASREAGEPLHANVPGGASLWWRWTPSVDCSTTIEIGSQADTLVAVYTGSQVDQLTEVASNDNATDPLLASSVSFSAIMGQTYSIVVDTWGGATGDFELKLTTPLPPPNDAFAAAVQLVGRECDVPGTTVGATNEPGVPGDVTVGGSVWWTWTAPADGTARFDLDEDTGEVVVLEVFAGNAVDALVPQPNLLSSTSAFFPRHDVRVQAGVTYAIAGRGVRSTTGGSFRLKLVLRDPPANDDFARRTVLTGELVDFLADTRGATREPGEPSLADTTVLSTSVWYSWTALRTGTVVVSAPRVGSMEMAAFRGNRLDGLALLVGTELDLFAVFPRDRSEITFPVTAGETYAIVIDAISGATGVSTVRLEFGEPPPNEARFRNPTPLVGRDVRLTATTRFAAGALEWLWTAPASGRLSIVVEDSEVLPAVTLMDIATGSGYVNHTSEYYRHVYFVTAGQTFRLAVRGDPNIRFGSGQRGRLKPRGEFTLDLSLQSGDIHDRFELAAPLTGTSFVVRDTNRASRSGGLDIFDGVSPDAPLWWTWTAPADGYVHLSTKGSAFRAQVLMFWGERESALQRVGHALGSERGDGTAAMTVEVRREVKYYIALDAPSGGAGDVVLSFDSSPPPAHDELAAALPLAGSTVATTSSNLGATAAAGEPWHGLAAAGSSVWWTWVAPADGEYLVTTAGSDFDTLLAVYRGDSYTSLIPVASSDDAGGGLAPDATFSRVQFSAVAGTAYRIAVDGYAGDVGSIALQLQSLVPLAVSLEGPAHPPVAGEAITMRATASGRGPFTYQWRRNGVPIAGATDAALTLPSVQRFVAGEYTVLVRDADGSHATSAWSVTAAAPPPSGARVLNLSTRAFALGGDAQLIPGFVVDGAAGSTKRLLMRAVGPTLRLAPINFSGAVVPDPRLLVQRFNAGLGAYEPVAVSDDWVDQPDAAELALEAEQVGAFSLLDPAEAALLLELPPGQYTALAGDAQGSPGVALVEIYDTDGGGATNARLLNVSSRGFAGRDEQVMIPGFVVSAEGAKTFLIRVVGPTLANSFGISGTMADPRLRLFRAGEATPLLEQDNWEESSGATYTVEIANQVFAFPLAARSADAAFVVTLPPGVYTVVGSSADSVGTGVVLVEVYVVP